DTLWHNESLYQATAARLEKILAPNNPDGRVQAELFQTEMRNLATYGYGLKSFGLSMIETAIRLSAGRVRGDEIQQIIDLVQGMVRTPVQLLDGVAEVVAELAASHRLMLITKGDLLDQERKLDQSGLAAHFCHVEIVSHKNAEVYRRLLAQFGVEPQRFLMVGNSLKSDVLPVVEIGGRAVHIPYHTTWAHEAVDLPQNLPKGFVELADISLLPPFVAQLGEQESEL
ncbi:MAG: HAD family hydrolase, partial [Anaerolineae bacterium]